MDLTNLSIKELHQGIEDETFSIPEILISFRQRFEETEPKIQAFLNYDWDQALKRAEKLEKFKADHKEDMLYGIPVGIKDVFMVKGMRTTAGSRILENYTAVYTATAVEKLLSAGIIIVGKNNNDEFAMGASCENSAFHPTYNPYDLKRVPGGSSGGSAASVAARQVAFSLGSDTGGSIRQPAAFCGAVALKPTYGLVSRYGLIAMASSLDTVGPITKTVEDTAIVYNYLVGFDKKDSTSYKLKEKQDYLKALRKSVKGLKVGIPRQAQIDKLSKSLQAEIQKTKIWLEAAGVIFSEVDLPNLDKALAVYYIIMPAEVSSNLARYDGIRYGQTASDTTDLLDFYMKTRGEFLGPEVKRRIMVGTYVLSAGYIDAYYNQAQKVRRMLLLESQAAFSKVDAILLPTTPSPAFSLGEKLEDPLQMYLADIYTVLANLAGIPALSVPSGIVDGLPFAVQLLGPHFSEGKLLSLGRVIEEARGDLPQPSI
jgi:aspartyl-tRNA(Asn)/glutamyl-tRNA(Gln) amidotransferase subunit A